MSEFLNVVDERWAQVLEKLIIPLMNIFVAPIFLEKGQRYQTRSIGQPLTRPFAKTRDIGYRVTDIN